VETGFVEPLHAVYATKACLPVFKSGLDAGVLAVHRLLRGLNVRYVPVEEWRRLDTNGLSFFNINRPEDLEKALRIEKERKGERTRG
jgi:molybdopterin-guanine dinucleotide biosynthesis protein A